MGPGPVAPGSNVVNGVVDLGGVGKHHGGLSDHGNGGLFAAPHAGRRDDFHIVAQQSRKAIEQRLGAAKFTGQPVADPNGEPGGSLPIAQDLEVVVERRDLEDFRHRHVHLARQCHQVPVVQAAILVVELVQVFDQQVATVRTGPDQSFHLGGRDGIRLAALHLAAFAQAATHLVDRYGGHCGITTGSWRTHLVFRLAGVGPFRPATR
jgi:hypothetical protein